MVKETAKKINNNNIKLNDIVFTLSQLVNERKCKKIVVRRDYCRTEKDTNIETVNTDKNRSLKYCLCNKFGSFFSRRHKQSGTHSHAVAADCLRRSAT